LNTNWFNSLNCSWFSSSLLVYSSQDNDFQDSLGTKDCSRCYKGLVKRVSPVSSSCSIQKVLKKAVKRCAALSVELNPGNSPGWVEMEILQKKVVEFLSFFLILYLNIFQEQAFMG
jgi:hypothetical protein